MLFSIIVSTIHDADALKPLFLSSSDDAEVIIIDSRYSEEKKNELKKISHQYKQVTYAPPKKQEPRLAYDFLSANNTGLAYAEGDWCFAIGDNWELKPDFFDRLRETIGVFTGLYENRFVVRPLELEPHNNDVRWVSYVRFPLRYIFLPCAPLGSTGLRSQLPIITCGAIIAHKETWYGLNGFDERYDVGAGWYDNDLFDRFLITRYPVILDQLLMTYRLPHPPSFSTQGRNECKKIYDMRDEVVRSPNPFDLRELHDVFIKEKGTYLL